MPWPIACPLVEQRIEAKHYAQHRERVAAATTMIDTTEPEHMHHHPDAKKLLAEQEREYEVQKENARLYSRLAAIEDLDSSKVLQSSLTRSSLNHTPGLYHNGPVHCVDHINLTATHNPHSVHYQPVSRQGSRQGSRCNSRHGSANPSPIRGSEVSASSHVWTGQLRRTSRAPSPDSRAASEMCGSSGSLTHRPPLPESSSTSVPKLPPLPLGLRPSLSGLGQGQGQTGAGTSRPNSRYTSPVRGAAVPAGQPATAAAAPAAADTPYVPSSAQPLRASSPARLPPQPPSAAHPPLPRPPPTAPPATSRSASPARPVGALARVPVVEAGSGLLRHGKSGELRSHTPESLYTDPSTVSMGMDKESVDSVSAADMGEKEWREYHAQRKAELANVYLAQSNLLVRSGSTLKAVRPSPYNSAHNSRAHSRANSRSASPLMASRVSLSGSSAALTSSVLSTEDSFPVQRPLLTKPNAPLPPKAAPPASRIGTRVEASEA